MISRTKKPKSIRSDGHERGYEEKRREGRLQKTGSEFGEDASRRTHGRQVYTWGVAGQLEERVCASNQIEE